MTTEKLHRRSREGSARMRVGRVAPSATYASRFFLAVPAPQAGGARGVRSHRVPEFFAQW